jgi:hypothetical protein
VQEETKDKGKGAKAAPAKGGAKGGATTLEEITDNRPREIQYIKNFAEEGGPIKFNEDIAKYFENFMLVVDIYSVDRETQEETKKESYELDLSPFLFET